MNVLYISYWSINDPLTVATVYPNLKVLSNFDGIDQIVFVNIQREVPVIQDVEIISDKIVYHPYNSQRENGFLIEKFSDFTAGPKFITKLVHQYKINSIISRGAPAGALAYLVWRKTKTPFYVESFEPHADYMLESKVWRRYDPRFILEKFFEAQQKKYAAGLMPVAENYSKALVNEGIAPERIRTVPCGVDDRLFSFSSEKRKSVRQELGISSNTTVGIYAGRYGGLYMEEDAFKVYKEVFSFFKQNFVLILLTSNVYHTWIKQQILKYELPLERIFIFNVKHNEVSDYLSASDFSFATYKPGESKLYLSPVKIAEYWANGLPVLLTNGIGDETRIIKDFPEAGILFNPDKISDDLKCRLEDLKKLIDHSRSATNQVTGLVSKFRNPLRVNEAYEYFLLKK